jgi:hypothetical protein
VRFFKKPNYKLIECTKPRLAPVVESEELRDALRALGSFPAFTFILDRLRTQRGLLEGRLRDTKFSRIEDVTFVQSGIFWTNWLEAELERLTKTPPKPELPATEQELIAFQEIDAVLERIGIEEPPQGE